MSDLDRATDLYTAAGSEVERYEGGGFAFVSYEDESVFDLDPAEAANKAGCLLVVRDADIWHERLSAAGLDVTDIATQPWGVREFTPTDDRRPAVRAGPVSGSDALQPPRGGPGGCNGPFGWE